MNTHLHIVIYAAASLPGALVAAQDISLRVLMPYENGAVIAASRPSLRDGVVSAYGVNRSPSRGVIYMGLLTDSPPPEGIPVTILAGDGDVIPNDPSRTFGHFSPPTVWNGVSYFSGGYGFQTVAGNTGVYAGTLDGGPLSVVVDRVAGEPRIRGPVAGETGFAYIHPEVSTGTGAGMSLLTYDHLRIPIVDYNQSMPGGGQMQSTNISQGDGWIAQGGGVIVFGVRCNAPAGSGSGVYTWDPSTGVTTLVANWNTLIPGDGRLMLYSAQGDTDGQRVAFVAANGIPDFGGVHAVCHSDLTGAGLVSIARTGQSVPGVPGATWRQFLHVAIDAGLVYFQARYRDGAVDRYAMFVHDIATGVTVPVILPGQVVGGHAILVPWFIIQGIDGRDAAIQVEYITPDQPFLQKYMLVHAHIGGGNCPADFNSDGTSNSQDFFDFLAGFFASLPTADFNFDGSINSQDFFDFIAAFFVGC